MSKIITATIREVEAALANLKALCAITTGLELQNCKKLGAVVELLTPKDGVTKDLNQAYTNAEKKWAMNYANDLDGCTKVNKLDKIQQYVLVAEGYNRHANDDESMSKVISWLADKFPQSADNHADLAA